MLIFIAVLSLVLYAFIVIGRTLDPLSKVIDLHYFVYLCLILLAMYLACINVRHPFNSLLIPLNVLTVIEILICIAYKRTKQLVDESTVVYINSLYATIAPYLLVIPGLTILGIVYMLCTG